jgi:hypothetical protein
MFWVRTELYKGCPSRFEQAPKDYFWIGQGINVQLRGQGKHHMEIRHTQKFAFPHPYPCFSFMSLTGRAMTVPAAVVTDVEFMAAIALIYMSAHGRCPAPTDGM